jgi:hypothetical protein
MYYLQTKPIEWWGSKEHFTLQPWVELTKDSNNLIGEEQKFVHLVFTLDAKGQTDNGLQNTYMVAFFGSFGVKNLCGG